MAPVLGFPYMNKTFVLEADVFGYWIGAVLVDV